MSAEFKQSHTYTTMLVQDVYSVIVSERNVSFNKANTECTGCLMVASCIQPVVVVVRSSWTKPELTLGSDQLFNSSNYILCTLLSGYIKDGCCLPVWNLSNAFCLMSSRKGQSELAERHKNVWKKWSHQTVPLQVYGHIWLFFSVVVPFRVYWR